MEEETRYVVCATRLLDQWHLKDVTEWRVRMVNLAHALLLRVMITALSASARSDSRCSPDPHIAFWGFEQF
jgi:hypothetical protein